MNEPKIQSLIAHNTITLDGPGWSALAGDFDAPTLHHLTLEAEFTAWGDSTGTQSWKAISTLCGLHFKNPDLTGRPPGARYCSGCIAKIPGSPPPAPPEIGMLGSSVYHHIRYHRDLFRGIPGISPYDPCYGRLRRTFAQCGARWESSWDEPRKPYQGLCQRCARIAQRKERSK